MWLFKIYRAIGIHVCFEVLCFFEVHNLYFLFIGLRLARFLLVLGSFWEELRLKIFGVIPPANHTGRVNPILTGGLNVTTEGVFAKYLKNELADLQQT